jgi:hypothetical protein
LWTGDCGDAGMTELSERSATLLRDLIRARDKTRAQDLIERRL